MIKFVHTADIHASDKLPYGRLNPKTGLDIRLEDLLKNFDILIERAIKEKVNFFLIVGDIYDDGNPTSEVRTEIVARFKRLNMAGIDVVAIVGNHGTDWKTSALCDIRKLKLKHIKIVNRCKIVKVGKCKIVCIPWLPLEEQLKFLNSRKFKKSGARILALHCDVRGAIANYSNYKIKTGIKRSSFKKILKVVDYVALGHLHKFQNMFKNRVYYCGSIIKKNFGEKDDLKGGLLVKIKNGNVSETFLTLRCRNFLKFKYPEEKIEKSKILGSIMDIQLTDSKYIQDDVRNKFKDLGAYFVKVRRCKRGGKPMKRLSKSSGDDLKHGLQRYIRDNYKKKSRTLIKLLDEITTKGIKNNEEEKE